MLKIINIDMHVSIIKLNIPFDSSSLSVYFENFEDKIGISKDSIKSSTTKMTHTIKEMRQKIYKSIFNKANFVSFTIGNIIIGIVRTISNAILV